VLLILLAVLFLAGAAYLFGEAATAPARDREVSVKRAANYGKFRAALGAREQPFRDRVIEPAVERLAKLVLRIHPKTNVEGVRGKLLAAGLGRTVSPTAFLAAKAAVGIGALFVGLLFSAVAGGIGLLLGLGLGAVGFLAPDFVVGARARKRRELIRAQLPDALDLLAVSVEAGLGFDAALAQITRYGRGPLAGEFARVLQEMQIGRARVDALRALATRTSVAELKSFCAIVVQASELGVPIANVLREQAREMRVRRRQRAEELAQKVPVKILFPLIFCLFPALFIVVLGPGVINILHVFR
jgi:tight adherence protein C